MNLFGECVGPYVLHSYPIADGYRADVLQVRHPADPDRIAYALLATRDFDTGLAPPLDRHDADFYDIRETLEEADRAARIYVERAKRWLADPDRKGNIFYRADIQLKEAQ